MKTTFSKLRTLFFLLIFLLSFSQAWAQNLGGISTAPIWQLRAGDITGTANNTRISSWAANIGPTPTQSNANNYPTYFTTGAGSTSLPFVQFNPNSAQSGNTQIAQGLSTSSLSSTSGSYTIFSVQGVTDITTANWVFDTQTGRLLAAVNTNGGANHGAGYYDGAFHDTGTNSSTASNAWAIYEWRFNATGSTASVYVNGTQVYSSTYSSKNIGGITAIGNAYDATTGAVTSAGSPAGNLAEMEVYGSNLSDSDRGSVGSALASKYGITTTYSGNVIIAPNNAGILYSPYNWLVTSGAAKSINNGAYWKTIINASATCVLNLNVGSATPYSQCWARVDGGGLQQYTPTAAGAQNWTLTVPASGTGLPAKHFVEFWLKSSTETQDRWNTQTTAIQVTGMTLDNGASVTLPAKFAKNVLFYGDSIPEGVRVNGNAATNDTDRNDNLKDFTSRLRELLQAEIGVVSFGGTGFTVAGTGNVPALTGSYNYLWSGTARSATAVPDLVIICLGANESGANVNTALSTVVSGINTLAGTNVKFLILRPLGGQNAANVQAAVTALATPNVVYGDTTGIFNSADSVDGTHPFGYSHLGTIAPQLANLIRPVLYPNGNGRGGFFF